MLDPIIFLLALSFFLTWCNLYFRYLLQECRSHVACDKLLRVGMQEYDGFAARSL